MSKEWFYQLMGSEIGPLSSVELRQKVTRGEITTDTPIRSGNSARWVDASQIKGLFDIPTPPAPLPPAARTTTPEAPEAQQSTPAPTSPDEEDQLDAHSDNEEYEFFKFVGFRQALTAKLYDEVDSLRLKQGWTMTQITRHALAAFVGKPELGEDSPPSSSVGTSSEE
ncbi:MAG: DUF4339 domain-containing protein [Planctomycetota bacterium]|nr:DUF4339 domain-containing protein [Planctomycetota bacterium]MDA1214046.1 DUF4339 domain-containing protein [Planctomycetota bacterium]